MRTTPVHTICVGEPTAQIVPDSAVRCGVKLFVPITVKATVCVEGQPIEVKCEARMEGNLPGVPIGQKNDKVAENLRLAGVQSFCEGQLSDGVLVPLNVRAMFPAYQDMGGTMDEAPFIEWAQQFFDNHLDFSEE